MKQVLSHGSGTAPQARYPEAAGGWGSVMQPAGAATLARECIGNDRDRVVRAFQRALARDNSLTRCCAVRALVKLEARDEITRESLISLLRDPDPDVRTDAAAALGRLRMTEAIAALVGNIEGDPEGEVRIEAVKALARIGSRDAVEPLIRCLKAEGYPELDRLAGSVTYGPWFEVQSQTLNALGELGDARAAGAVIEVLENDDYDDLQESGFRVLAQLDSAKAQKFLVGQLRTGPRLARRRAAMALGSLAEIREQGQDLLFELLNPLLNALTDTDPSVRIGAARALSGSGNPMVAVPLTLLLNDPDVEVRKEAATLCAGMRGPHIVERLHALLNEPDRALKQRVVQVLGGIGDAASVEPLSALLDGGDNDLRYEVAYALGMIAARGPEQKLAGTLANEKIHATTRVQVAWALGRILAVSTPPEAHSGTAGAANGTSVEDIHPLASEEVLRRAVHDPDERVSHAALRALVEMDPDHAAGMLTALVLGESEAVASSKSLETAERDAPSTREMAPELNALIAGHSPQTSTLVAILASQAETEAAAEAAAERARAAEPASRTPATSLQILAAGLLGGHPQAGPEAETALIQACEAGDDRLRKAALPALGRVGGRRAVPALLAALKAEDKEIRLLALEALACLRDAPDTTEPIAALCEDPDPYIRARALRALAAGRGVEVGERLNLALDDEHPEVCRAALAALSENHCPPECREKIVALMFRQSGALRVEAASTLRRLNDYTVTDRLLATLDDAGREEFHWLCIDALGELYAAGATAAGGSTLPMREGA